MRQNARGAPPASRGQQQEPSAPPTRGEEASVRELVESCLANDDFTPVLRLLFSSSSSAHAPTPGATSSSPPPSSTAPPQPNAATGPPGPSQAPSTSTSLDVTTKQQPSSSSSQPSLEQLELLQSVLRSVASEQDAVVQEICSSHAMEIATCVAELDRMVGCVEELRGAVAAAGGGELQRSGTAVAAAAGELSGLLAAQQHLAAAVGGLRALHRLLQRAAQVGEAAAQRRLFAALQHLERVKTTDLALALDVLSNDPRVTSALAATGGTAEPEAVAAAMATAASAGASSVSADGGAAATAATAAVVQVSLLPTRHQALVSRLRGFLQGLVSDLESAVEYFAVAEFNNWLVGVRAESRKIGLRAIRQAAIERQYDEDLAAERRTAAAALVARRHDRGGAAAVATAAAAVVAAAFRAELAQEGAAPPLLPPPPAAAGTAQGGGGGVPALGTAGARSSSSTARATAAAASAAAAAAGGGGGGSGGASQGAGSLTPPPQQQQLSPAELAALCPGQPLQAIHSLLQRHRASAALPPPPTCTLSDATTGLMQGVDMQGLHRCVHIHACLGLLPSLRRTYLQQRRLQIRTDLAPPPNFLEGYQAYLAQVVGFFVVEDAVRSCCPPLLPPGSSSSGPSSSSEPDSGSLLWEEAAGGLRGVLARALEEALSGGAPASIMLLLKDFMLLVCSALGTRGFTTAPIMELLVASRQRYHELLTASVALRVARALAADPLGQPVRVESRQQEQELAGRLGLPGALEAGGGGEGGCGPPLPYPAPYSASVPRILQAVRGFVADSLAYLQGLLSPWELLPAVLQARDRLIAKTVVDALSDHTARLLAAGAASASSSSSAAAAAVGGINGAGIGAGGGGGGSGGGGWRVGEVMRMVANAWCLAAAMRALDEWTLLRVRPLGAMAAAAAAAATAGSSSSAAAAGGAPLSLTSAAGGGGGGGGSVRGGGASAKSSSSVSSSHSYADVTVTSGSGGGGGGFGGDCSIGAVLAALRSVQDAGERGLLRLIAGRVEALVGRARGLNWLPAGPLPPGTSPYVDELLLLLKDTFDTASSTLPRSSFLFLARAVVRALGSALLGLMKEGIKAYNLFAIQRLAADVAALDAFIAAACPRVPHLAAEFAEPRQLCALLLAPRVEEVLIPEVRRQRYPSLDLASLVVILERYRECSRVGKEKTGHVSKRTLEGVSKQLRAQMVSGTAVSGLKVLEDV